MNQNSLSILEKNKITLYSFFLTVLVILKHSFNNSQSALQDFVINDICQFAIPGFFIISGFLFFVNAYNIKTVLLKIKKRINTVLIPYFMWNIIYCLLNVIIKKDIHFDFNECLMALTYHTYNPVFWYIYQLLVLIALTPLIFYIIQNKHIYIFVFLVLFGLIIFNFELKFVNIDALIYFLFGAILSKKYNDNLFVIINKNNIKKYFLFFCIVLFFTTLFYKLIPIAAKFDFIICYYIYVLLQILTRLCGAMFIFYILDYFYDYIYLKNYMKINFFIYATHYLIIRILFFVLHFFQFLLNKTVLYNMFTDLYFILSPLICIYICFNVSNILKEKFKNYYYLLTGGR